MAKGGLSRGALGRYIAPPPPPEPPAQAADAGYTHLYFNDDFDNSSTFDLTNSRAPGFNWYINNSWSNCVDHLPNNWRDFSPTNPACLSFSNSVLTVNDNDFSATGGIVAMTACDDGNGGYNGFVAPDGWYIECRMKYDTGAGTNAIAFWVDPIEFMLGQAVDFVEVDIMENFNAGAGGGHGIVLNWHYNSTNVTNPADRSAAGAGYYQYGLDDPVAIEDNTDFHDFGCLWKPISLFGSPGKYHFYVDDTERDRDTVGPPPTPWPAGPTTYTTAGVGYGKGEGQHMVPILFAGDNEVVHFARVRVWGPPP